MTIPIKAILQDGNPLVKRWKADALEPHIDAAQIILEAARQPFLVLDPQMRILSANPSFCKFFRVSLSEIVGKSLDQVCNCSWDHPKLKEALLGLPATNPSFDDIEIELEFPEIGRRTLKLNARVVAPNLGPEAHTVLSIEDVTDLLRAEQALRDSEARFRRLFETAQDGILIMDAATGRIIQANPYLARLLGHAPEDLEGRELLELGFFETADAFRGALRHLQDTGFIRFEDLPLRARDGRTIEVEFVCNVYPMGERNMIQCNIRDVGERKRAERALRETERKLRKSQKMEAIGTLAGGVAHEYNNLLTAINGFASLSLVETGPGEPLHGYLSEIAQAGERAATLTKQLLAYSRRQVMAPRLVDPNALVSRVITLVERLVEENIGLEQYLDPDIGLVKADPGQIEQALLNLVLNARDAMPQGGRLIIKTGRASLDKGGTDPQDVPPPGEYALLSISDTGVGMDEEMQARIFDPFYSTYGISKSGLGLSMVQGVIAQSEGYVATESEPGRGSTFKIFLPLAGQGPNGGGGEFLTGP